jgi:putative ABC transport system permease protein
VDLLPTGTVGLRARRLRTALSALGVAIGIASIVGVLGITRSSQADLLRRLDRLGTNLLTVTSGQNIAGEEVDLPITATQMIARTDGVQRVASTAELGRTGVYRSDQVPPVRTGGLAVRACDSSLLAALDGRVRQGTFLSQASARFPTTVLGYEAARTLGIDELGEPTRVWISGHWFTVTGILDPLELAPEIDRSALIGLPVAKALLGQEVHPTRIYVRSETERTAEVAGLLAAAAWPEHPEQVTTSGPSDALAARLAVASSATALFLGLGAVALLVSGIGIANVMVIAVLERRSEIGLRRALGATRGHVAAQFLTESLLLATLGGALGVLLGGAITVTIAVQRGWTAQVPALAIWGGLAAALAIGTVAGLYPALRAARLSPAQALRTV